MIKLKDLLFEQLDSNNTAGILYSYYNKFLLCLTERSRQWNVPKGHIKNGETDIEGSLREFTEETQILLNGTPIKLQSYDRDNGGKFHLFAFEGEKKFTPHLNHEHTDWGYFTKDKLPTPINESVSHAIEKYYN